MGSMLASNDLVMSITGQSSKEERTFVALYESVHSFGSSIFTQKKIRDLRSPKTSGPEEISQFSEGKSRIQSRSPHQSVACIAVAPIHSTSLH